MRLIDADALKEQLFELATMYPGSDKAISEAIGMVDKAHVVEGGELEALVDNIDYDWLLEQEY